MNSHPWLQVVWLIFHFIIYIIVFFSKVNSITDYRNFNFISQCFSFSIYWCILHKLQWSEVKRFLSIMIWLSVLYVPQIRPVNLRHCALYKFIYLLTYFCHCTWSLCSFSVVPAYECPDIALSLLILRDSGCNFRLWLHIKLGKVPRLSYRSSASYWVHYNITTYLLAYLKQKVVYKSCKKFSILNTCWW